VNVAIGDLLDDAGNLHLNPEIESGDYFAVSLRKGIISLRARGYIGYVPLSDDVIIHVRPRVPVSNLSRVISVSGEPPTVLSTMRGYATTSEWNESLLDVYARSLAEYVERIASGGLLRDYMRREEESSFPRGRIMIKGTLRARARGVRHRASVAWFERSDDNAPNRCLKYALWLLTQRYIAAGPGDRESREAHRHLVALYPIFDGVVLDHSREFLNDPQIVGARPLPSLRGYYRDALNVAVAIIRQRAILVDSPGGPIRMPSVVLNMNYVFEAYVRNILRRYVRSNGVAATVLDGNGDGRRPLYDGKTTPPATPDIIVQQTSSASPPVVVEVKNVPVKETESERAYVNQAATYGLVYRASKVVLVHPRASLFQDGGLHHLGDIDHVSVYQYRLDMGASDLPEEEHRCGETIVGLLQDGQGDT
jgi:5-methylcytosine-specific restriction enzyme subunit McrC